MTTTITEYQGSPIARSQGAIPLDIGLTIGGTTVVTTNVISSGGGVSTIILQPTTRIIRIATTAPAWILCSASSASTSVVTSTNAPMSVPNTYELRGVIPGSRITALST